MRHRASRSIGNLRRRMDQLIEQFFQQFEQANTSSDLATIGSLYADTFMFGGASGVKVVKKEDFLKVVPRMKAHYASMGLSGTELTTLEANALDSRYIFAKACWRMTLRDRNGDRKQIDAFATY